MARTFYIINVLACKTRPGDIFSILLDKMCAWRTIDVPRGKPETLPDYMRRYPRVTAHIIAESLGYATPSRAASILKDAHEDRENWCEWIYSCYNRDPRKAVSNATRNRHTHHGYMAEYKLARALVQRAIEKGEEPTFASWF